MGIWVRVVEYVFNLQELSLQQVGVGPSCGEIARMTLSLWALVVAKELRTGEKPRENSLVSS